MMVSRGAERMARPSQMAPRMQVQSAIASPPACGRVCAHLSCLVLHARTLRHLSQPAARRPFAPAAAPLSLAASQSLAGRCGDARSMGAPESARTCARRLGPLGRRRAHMPPSAATRYARSPRGRRRACGKRLIGVRRIGQRSGVPPGSGCWAHGH